MPQKYIKNLPAYQQLASFEKPPQMPFFFEI